MHGTQEPTARWKGLAAPALPKISYGVPPSRLDGRTKLGRAVLFLEGYLAHEYGEGIDPLRLRETVGLLLAIEGLRPQLLAGDPDAAKHMTRISNRLQCLRREMKHQADAAKGLTT